MHGITVQPVSGRGATQPTRPQRRGLALAGAATARAAAGAASQPLGSTGFGLERQGLDLRHPRLSQALVSLRSAGRTEEDWRKVPPEELVAGAFGERWDARTLLASAVFCGTAQALLQGSYWAPSFTAPGAAVVECHHMARPMSCLYTRRRSPQDLRPRGRSQEPILCDVGRSPLDVAAHLLSGPVGDQHIAVLRFTGMRDRRIDSVKYGHCTEDQLFLRTSYFQAFERMESDLNSNVGEALDEGCLIYTSGVGLLRGPIREGAPWLREPAKIDVMWVAVPAHPEKGDRPRGHHEWYNSDTDQAEMAQTLDAAFGWAAARGCDAVVLPPIGCDSHGCSHPPLGVAALIREVAFKYRAYLPRVIVASDLADHSVEWWEAFSQVAVGGRAKPDAVVLVPPIPLPPHVYFPKEDKSLLEKTRRLNSSRGRRTDGSRSLGLSARAPLRLAIY